MEGNGLTLSLIQASVGRRRPRPRVSKVVVIGHSKDIQRGSSSDIGILGALRSVLRRPGWILIFLQQNLLARVKLHVKHRGIIDTV